MNHKAKNTFSHKTFFNNVLKSIQNIFHLKPDSFNLNPATKYVVAFYEKCELSEIAPKIFDAFGIIDYDRDYENKWEWIQNDPGSIFHLNISRPHNWKTGDYEKPIEITFKRNGIPVSETESLFAAIQISLATKSEIKLESHNYKNFKLIREPILTLDTNEFSSNPNLNKNLNSNIKNEILALIALAALLKFSVDSVYSSVSASDAYSFVNEFILDLLSNREPNFNKLSVALLPTSWIQELSMSNGWSNYYLNIAAILDDFTEKNAKSNHEQN